MREAMRVEHCGKEDHAVPFSTSNGIEGATAEREWEFVVAPDMQRDRYAERGGDFREKHPKWCRVAQPLSAFKEAMAERNTQLRKRGHVEMELDEFIAGRLYTGPMYEKYNGSLRFHTVPFGCLLHPNSLRA